MADIIYIKDRIKYVEPVIPEVVKEVTKAPKVDKLDVAIQDLYDRGIPIIGEYNHVFTGNDGTYLFMLHQKTLKIHMESLSALRDNSWLFCGKFIWTKEDDYSFFENDDPVSFLTCEKCMSLYLYGRMHL